MAGNPKYGLTYKTSDGKTKTLTGINLGTGSYTSEQISAFVGIVAEVTNKTVTALDVTTANAIPPPEPPKDLIESFTISPSTLTATIGGDPVTAEIEITTSPQDANYQLRIEDAPNWVSIDDTTLIFAPPVGTAPDHYLFTVVAMTKDDSKEFAVTLNVEKIKKDCSLAVAPYGGVNSGTKQTYRNYKLTFNGKKDGRTVEVTGYTPRYTTTSYSSASLSYYNHSYDEATDTTTLNVSVELNYSSAITVKTGSTSATAYFKILESDEYKESDKVSCTIKDGYAKSSYLSKHLTF